jgi:hypothetical protein
MKKHTFSLLTLLAIVTFVSCGKDKDDNPPAPTKTQHLTTSTWKLSGATANGIPVMGFIDACWKDNVGTFVSTTEGSGTGTMNEGAIICSGGTQSTPFTWNFQSNETILFMSIPLIPTGLNSFNLVTLNETSLVVSQVVTIPPAGAQTVVFTFSHP